MNPTGIGGFQKGQSGNPGGKPAELAEVKALARKQTEASINTLVAIRDDLTAPKAARVAAANSLLDRAWGKPAQALEHSGPDGSAITTDTGFQFGGAFDLWKDRIAGYVAEIERRENRDSNRTGVLP